MLLEQLGTNIMYNTEQILQTKGYSILTCAVTMLWWALDCAESTLLIVNY